MDIYGVLFGIWFGVGCYRMFEMFAIDKMNEEEGYDEAEAYGVSPTVHFLFGFVSAYGWPVLMPYAHFFVARDEDEDDDEG